ncbi:related to ubiquitin carboxyl-terminal hydrolase 10 [Cephalotrichum gorgonifer]|uniref:Ubiquitin carboxyl-terminal hydrolase n=1 Tax=Cephalotrichum gorgonifer TaxID=2041049 RepID=A0AAE8MRF0_9PEZI|nr:related to ubiquitin carboxyl-terminal hydrolase 10 [Cephalotrichum gorgonifer]
MTPPVEVAKVIEPQPTKPQAEVSPIVAPRPPFRAPLPWLSNPDEPFPKRLAKPKRKLRQPLDGVTTVELPIEQHEGAANHVPKAADAQTTAASSPTTAVNPIQTRQPASPRPADATAATPSTPASTQPTPASSSSPASANATKSSSRPAVPAVPVLPAVPKADSKYAKDPAGEGGEELKPDTAESNKTKVNGTPQTDHAEASPVAPAPAAQAPQKPKSWASLLSTPASRRAAATASSGASSTASAGPAAASADAQNGSTDLFPKAADSLAEALRAYRVGATNTITHIEPRGLINGGNMCYMNSVLQVLLFCGPFYDFLDYISKKAAHSFKRETPLMDAMIVLMREFRVTGSASSIEQLHEVIKGKDRAYGDPLSPNFLFDEMKRSKWFATFEQGHQQDAEEFLGLLLQALDTECSQVMGVDTGANTSVSVQGTDTTASSEKGDASDMWLEVGPRQKSAITRSSGSTSSSPISKIFGGLLRSEFRVPGLKPSITTEPYQPLQLDIGSPHVRNIIDAMKGLTSQEKLHGDFNSLRGKNVEASKQVLIDELPPVLILHLKRFQFDTAGGTLKIAKKVGYPLDLEIPREVLSRQKLASLGKTLPRYKLFAVVYHHGKNASVGHYTVDVRRQDGAQWIRIDDTKIEPIRAEDVTRDGSDEEGVKETRKEGVTNGGSSNRFGAINGEDGGDNDGWKQVSSSANGGNKKWSSVANGGKSGSKSKLGQEGGSERSVAYLLFYQRV